MENEKTHRNSSLTLSRHYDLLSRQGRLNKHLPAWIVTNLNPKFVLRPYQVEALARFIHYLEQPHVNKPIHLLFNMATGSGKTLLMAASILHLYNKGYRNVLFFVNSNNIIEKTRENFLNPQSPKYLFNEKLVLDDATVVLKEVSNFDEADDEDINIIFTTVQGLHAQLSRPKENMFTIEDFRDKKMILISDEAHHVNAWTRRKKLSLAEELMRNTWEHSVMQILQASKANIMLEYTATIDLEHPEIYQKYKDKIIFEYDLKQFHADKYSKEVRVLQADVNTWQRMLQAVVLSQYRKKIAERHHIWLKPVILFKSKSIKESKQHHGLFIERMRHLSMKELKTLQSIAAETILATAFRFFDENGITLDNLAIELKTEFAEEKCMLLDSQHLDKEKQVLLNTLEDERNEIRAIFAVRMLDEGWDVLNLFDIVRLYDTRDGRWTKKGKYIPGKTTMAEKQLIGRGARYYPFSFGAFHEPFKRKFDDLPTHPLRILEELYYHSNYNPSYIKELTITLKESGLITPSSKDDRKLHVEPVTQLLKISDEKNPSSLLNKCIDDDKPAFATIMDARVKKSYRYHLSTDIVKESQIFLEKDADPEGVTDFIACKTIYLGDFGDSILRRAMARLNFYKFSNLKQFFPRLRSSTDFIDSLKEISVEIQGSSDRLDNLTPDDKLRICIYVLSQVESQIKGMKC